MEKRTKLIINHDENSLRRRADIFSLIGGYVEGASDIAAGIASSIEYSNETEHDYILLLVLYSKSLTSEQNDILNIIKKCIDDIFENISDSEKTVAIAKFTDAFFQDEKYNTPEEFKNNYLRLSLSFNKMEPLLLYLLKYDCNDKALQVLGSKYHSPTQATFQALFLRQIERRYHAAIEQGISNDKLFFPEKIDKNPEIPSTLRKGGKKPGKGNVLIITNGFGIAMGSTYDYAFKEIPEWFPANRYAVSQTDLSVIILLDHSTRVEAYYSGGITAVRKLVTVYAINVSEGRVYAEYGPIYGSKPATTSQISVASGTTGISGGEPSDVEITNVINSILKGII